MLKPKIAKKGPYIMNMEPDVYIWCGCGFSKDDPFCDNAHKGTEYEGTDQAALCVEVMDEGEKAWCGCKHTKTPPWCDGSHKKLPIDNC